MTDGDGPGGDRSPTDPQEDDPDEDTPTDDAVTPDDGPEPQAADGSDDSKRGTETDEPASEDEPTGKAAVEQSRAHGDDQTDAPGDDGGNDAQSSDEGKSGESDPDLELIEDLQAEYREHGAADWDPENPEEGVEPVDWDEATSGVNPFASTGEDQSPTSEHQEGDGEDHDQSPRSGSDVVGPNPDPNDADDESDSEETDVDSEETSVGTNSDSDDPDASSDQTKDTALTPDPTPRSDDPGDHETEDRSHRKPSYLEGRETEVPDRDPDHAPDDEEMPLAEHVEEMVRRLGVVLLLMAGVSAIVFPFGERIINVIWYSLLPGSFELCPTTSVVPRDPGAVIVAALGDVGAGPGVTMAESESIKPACPRVYHPLATILARFKVATLAGFVIALPAVVYETYLFMRPGLFPRERRYYLAAVPTSLILAAFGVAFAYLLVLPAIFTYFLYYSEGAADIAFSLTETFDLMVLMLGFFAAIFQIPLFIMLAIMMGVTSRQWLADRRLLFWAAFAGIAFLFNPDPTGMAPFIIAATMIALFEGTLLLLSWTGSEGLLPSPEAVEARRPYAWLAAGVAGYLASAAPLPSGFYDQLPGLVRGYIESNGLLGVTPLVVGGAIVAVYELVVFLLNRYLPVGKRRRQLFTGRVSLQRLRTPVWIVSLVIGYFASPKPFLLAQADALALEPVSAGALTVGLIVAFEVLLAVWKYTRPDEDERLPLEH
ncbi:MAG: twin-arginine translocase subunit TatC [Halorhabdus sp.]